MRPIFSSISLTLYHSSTSPIFCLLYFIRFVLCPIFGEKLARWMEEKKYLSAQLTIDDLATEMGTNKLYMSRYINRKYEVNFSTLITRLRLSEAKEYMLAHPNVKQEEVALHSGFSSSSYFSKVFSREEGITPVLWRKAQAAVPYEM